MPIALRPQPGAGSEMAVLTRDVPVAPYTATGSQTRLTSQVSHSGTVGFAFYNIGAVTVYLGGPDVTPGTGVPVAAASWSPSLDLAAGDIPYGCTLSTQGDVRVLESGV